MEGARRAAKHTQSKEECTRVGGQPNILRAGRSVGEQEGSQTHSEPPSTLRAGGRGGEEREGSQAHSEPGGVVEGGGRAAKHTQSQGGVVEGGGRAVKHTQSREEWWRGPGGQPNTLRARRSVRE